MASRNTTILSLLVLLMLTAPFVSPVLAQGQSDNGRGRGRGGGDRETNRDVGLSENSEEVVLNGENIIVKFEGKNPHAKFFLNEYSDSEAVFYKIMFKSLVEVDGTGKAANPTTHSFNGLESQSFSNTVEETSTDDGDQIKVTFETSVPIDGTSVTVIFHFYIFGFDYQTTISSQQASTESTAQSTETKEEVSVLASSEVKFDVEIHDWPFLSDDNKLELGVRLIGISRIMETEVEDEEQVTTTTEVQEVDHDSSDEPSGESEEGYMILPETAIADGEEVDIEREYKKNGNMDYMLLRFPSFSDDLYYDPVLGIGDPVPFYASPLLIGVIAGLVILAAVVIYQRKSDQS